jgi:hypothetical protein
VSSSERTFTDVSLKDMAKPIKPETMPLGTQVTNLWMTSRPRIHKGIEAGSAVSNRATLRFCLAATSSQYPRTSARVGAPP